jgi:CRISPR-associated protein Csy3
MAAKKTNHNSASVLAFDRRLSSSNAIFFGVNWKERDKIQGRPLSVQEKSVRGVIDNRLKSGDQTQTKVEAKIESPNLQTVDYCALGLDEDTLRVRCNIQLAGKIEPCACNNQIVANKIAKMSEMFVQGNGFLELCRRYAINLANGRFLWRNRLGADNIEIKIIMNEDKEFIFDALKISLNNFDYESQDIDEICKEMTRVLSGERSHLNIHIDACIRRFQGMEVYPSQELVLDGSNAKGKKSKHLFKAVFKGSYVAALHPQKVTNAIHTIDNWYEDAQKLISINSYGAVTSQGKAYRDPKKNDFYTLFDAAVEKGLEEIEKDEQLYVMAMLVRGGVFGAKGE